MLALAVRPGATRLDRSASGAAEQVLGDCVQFGRVQLRCLQMMLPSLALQRAGASLDPFERRLLRPGRHARTLQPFPVAVPYRAPSPSTRRGSAYEQTAQQPACNPLPQLPLPTPASHRNRRALPQLAVRICLYVGATAASENAAPAPACLEAPELKLGHAVHGLSQICLPMTAGATALARACPEAPCRHTAVRRHLREARTSVDPEMLAQGSLAPRARVAQGKGLQVAPAVDRLCSSPS
jgi:hypothetical protein